MRLKSVKFLNNVDVRGQYNSGCVAERGIELYRAPNGDVIVTWEASGGIEADQVIVGAANVVFSKPATRIATEAKAATEPPAKK